MASYRRGAIVRFRTAGARDRRYWSRSRYSLGLTVYRSALRRMGSIRSGSLDGADAPDAGGDTDIMSCVLESAPFWLHARGEIREIRGRVITTMELVWS